MSIIIGKTVPAIIATVTISVLLLIACTDLSAAPNTVPTPTPAWISALEPLTQDGVRFLEGQYNAELGLLQESTTIRSNNDFLTS